MDTKAQIQNITLTGLVANICLSIVKFSIGFWGNSQAVVADALHSLSDTSSDLVILFGVKYWTAPPDDSHPYGHQKIESCIAIIISFIILSAACAIGYKGLVMLQAGNNHPELKWIVVIGPLISIIIKEILFKITYKVGIKTNSPSLKANAWHHRADALSSIPVFIAVAASLIDPKLRFLDQVAAVIVSAFIVKVGLEIFINNINDLLDTGISKEKIRELKKTINNIQSVRGVHKFRTRKIANYIYIDLHLEVDGQLSVIQGHDISEQVKHTLIETNPKIIDVMVHLEPEKNLSGLK